MEERNSIGMGDLAVVGVISLLLGVALALPAFLAAPSSSATAAESAVDERVVQLGESGDPSPVLAADGTVISTAPEEGNWASVQDAAQVASDAAVVEDETYRLLRERYGWSPVADYKVTSWKPVVEEVAASDSSGDSGPWMAYTGCFEVRVDMREGGERAFLVGVSGDPDVVEW